MTQELKTLKNLHFNGQLLAKIHVWAKKSTEKLYFMALECDAEFEEKLTCGLKMTWGIWKIFTRAHEILKIGTVMASFCLKLKMYELKIYRGVMCHDNEEWCKNWRGIELPVQMRNDMRNLTNLTWALKYLPHLHFKVYNAWATKLQRIYISWH